MCRRSLVECCSDMTPQLMDYSNFYLPFVKPKLTESAQHLRAVYVGSELHLTILGIPCLLLMLPDVSKLR